MDLNEFAEYIAISNPKVGFFVFEGEVLRGVAKNDPGVHFVFFPDGCPSQNCGMRSDSGTTADADGPVDDDVRIYLDVRSDLGSVVDDRSWMDSHEESDSGDWAAGSSRVG